MANSKYQVSSLPTGTNGILVDSGSGAVAGGGGGSHNNIQPSLALNYIIKN